jgi:hypothetical protein
MSEFPDLRVVATGVGRKRLFRGRLDDTVSRSIRKSVNFPHKPEAYATARRMSLMAGISRRDTALPSDFAEALVINDYRTTPAGLPYINGFRCFDFGDWRVV